RKKLSLNSHDQLAEVLPREHAEKGVRRGVEAVDDVLAVLDPFVAYVRRHFLEERRRAIRVITDDEALNHRAIHEQRQQVRSLRRLGRVVFGYESAQRDARATVEEARHGLEHRTADVLEVDVDA